MGAPSFIGDVWYQTGFLPNPTQSNATLQVYQSVDDGVTWTLKNSSVFYFNASRDFYTSDDGSLLWISYCSLAGKLTFVSFDPVANAFGVPNETLQDAAGFGQIAKGRFVGSKWVFLNEFSAGVSSVYTYDTGTHSLSVIVTCGYPLGGIAAAYPTCVLHSNGSTYLIGGYQESGIGSPIIVWVQSVDVNTLALGALQILINEVNPYSNNMYALNGDCTDTMMFLAVSKTGGQVLDIWTGTTDLTFAMVSTSAIPAGYDLASAYQGVVAKPVSVGSSDSELVVMIQDTATAQLFQYATFTTSLSAWTVLGDVGTPVFNYIVAIGQTLAASFGGSAFFWILSSGPPPVTTSLYIGIIPPLGNGAGPIYLPDIRKTCVKGKRTICSTIDCCGRQMMVGKMVLYVSTKH